MADLIKMHTIQRQCVLHNAQLIIASVWTIPLEFGFVWTIFNEGVHLSQSIIRPSMHEEILN